MNEKLTNILLWPQTKTNHMVPWFVIVWRLLWFVPIHFVSALLIFFIAISYGLETARSTIDDLY